MPCIYCIAVFAVLAGAVTTAVLDQLEARLAAGADGPVRRSVDTASVAKLELTLAVPAVPGAPRSGPRTAPVAVTVYKAHRRARIQVLTHDLTRPQAEALEDRVAALAGLRVVERSAEADEAKVREAVAAPAPQAGARALGAASPGATRCAESAPPPRSEPPYGSRRTACVPTRRHRTAGSPRTATSSDLVRPSGP